MAAGAGGRGAVTGQNAETVLLRTFADEGG
jgi:hypothetical protein